MDLRVININDIEELILAKHDIEKYLIENNTIESKLELNDFISNYILPDYIYVVNDNFIPFKLISFDSLYLFITDNNEENTNLLMNKLKSMKFDMNNKVEINSFELQKNPDSFNSVIIHNKKYYK